MRILHLTDHYLPVLGGIETHVSALAARQAERGDDVSVLTTTAAVADGQVCEDTGPVGVRRVRSVVEGARERFESFDVVHAHVSVVAPFTQPMAAMVARRGVPTVVTVHSLWNGLGPFPEAAARVAGLRRAPVVWTAVSEVAARELRLRLPRHAHVALLPNAVAVPPRERTPGKPADGIVRLVSTMRIARRKRPVQLVRMFEALRAQLQRPVSLTIIGDGPQRRKLDRLLLMRGLQGEVTVTGRVDPAEVIRLLAQADVYVAPAVLESFGLAALEARCVGLPVVGRAASGMADFIGQGVEGMLCDSDAHMVRNLRDLVTDDDLRARISEHNRTVPSRFTWPHAMQQHDTTYAFACASVHSRSRRSLRPALER